jgi:RimJ/RimL family protein N-acetyltransferase
VTLREATTTDARLLFEWRNDPGTRAASLDSQPLAWEEHVAWLKRVVADPRRALYVAVDDRGPLGTARLDAGEDDHATISITIAPERRGEGLATPLIAAACARAGGPVVAIVKPENARSVRAFERAGFRRTGTEDGSLRLVRDGG